jgi:hypothetical protein
MAVLGNVLLWAFAVFGFVTVCGLVGVAFEDRKKELEAKEEGPKPAAPAQIVNLREIPRPATTQEDQPQILQKTTMQITTTKYTDPNVSTKELSA